MRVKKAKALSNPAEAGEGAGADRPKLLEAYGESHMGYLIDGLIEAWDTLTLQCVKVQKIGQFWENFYSPKNWTMCQKKYEKG